MDITQRIKYANDNIIDKYWIHTDYKTKKTDIYKVTFAEESFNHDIGRYSVVLTYKDVKTGQKMFHYFDEMADLSHMEYFTTELMEILYPLTKVPD